MWWIMIDLIISHCNVVLVSGINSCIRKGDAVVDSHHASNGVWKATYFNATSRQVLSFKTHKQKGAKQKLVLPMFSPMFSKTVSTH